jgi:signal transduction histidine kinase
MSPPLRSAGLNGAALTRQFAALSFVVIALITAALGLLISHYLRQDLLDREWRTTADFIRTEASQTLVPTDFAAPAAPEARTRFRRFFDYTLMMPEIVRVKIYDADGRVVWSDEERLIGERFADNPQLTAALAGRIDVNLEAGAPKQENIYERKAPRLVEVYVPLSFPGTTGVVGVVETYRDPSRVLANIRRAQVTAATTAMAGGGLLYLSLFWIVRRAGRRIDAQHRALEDRSRELSDANEALRAAHAQLFEAERMAAVGQAVTAVVHGLRNPLANIRASAQVAALDGGLCESKVAATSLGNIVSEVDRLENRLKELLQFVRPAERRRQPVDLNAVARSALAQVASRVIEAQVKVDEDLGVALPACRGDAMLLEQVVLSLLANAVEATPPGGTIALSSGVERGERGVLRCFVEVRDTGPGIAPEKLGRIFDIFFTTKPQGTGLGLAIAKRFTEAHGGTITVDSRPGEGATFRVTLPAASGA